MPQRATSRTTRHRPLTPLAENQITFLAFLVSRPAVHTLRRAFPQVRIVTAALDSELKEVHLPLLAGVSGEAVGDADYGSRLVARADSAEDVDPAGASARMRRSGSGDGGVPKEKIAWVVRPGMGHIG